MAGAVCHCASVWRRQANHPVNLQLLHLRCCAIKQQEQQAIMLLSPIYAGVFIPWHQQMDQAVCASGVLNLQSACLGRHCSMLPTVAPCADDFSHLWRYRRSAMNFALCSITASVPKAYSTAMQYLMLTGDNRYIDASFVRTTISSVAVGAFT
eukprot:GHRQ01017493.1.p1 GENE.GHRQ01017493.1~~GHRQ01017493.1.p1  ORF type:complete len:153 (-),score=4.21 GHRQ01017493.1:1356-1814(-)